VEACIDECLLLTNIPNLAGKSRIMAPALVEEVTQHQSVGYKSGVGQYKEAAFGGPKVFQKELELRGTEKHAPAKYPNYLPTWANETEK
jgi:sulfonate dioxygenase